MTKPQSRLTGAIALMISQGIVLVLGFITHFWVARTLGEASYGNFGVVLSIQTIFGLVLTLGAPVAVSRYVAQDPTHAQSILKQVIRIQATIALALALAILLLSRPLAYLLGDNNLTNLIRFVAPVILLQALYPIYIQFLSGMHRFNKQAQLTSLYAVAKLIGAVTLIYFFGVVGAFAGFAVGGIMAAIIGWYWTRRIGGQTPHHLPIKSFLSFAGTYVLILVGLQLLISLDLFMVKAILKDNVQTGYYSAAVTLSRISFMLLQSLTFILLPSVSALTKPGSDHDQAVKFIAASMRYLIALIVPSVALAATTSHGLIQLFYSTQYTPADASLTILMVGLGALGFYLLLTSIVSGAGQAKLGLGITVALLVISGLLGTVLIPRFGIIGAALQTTTTGIIGLLVLGTYTFRSFKIPIPLRSTVNIIIASTIAVSPTYIWSASSLFLPLQYVLLLLLYLGALALLGEINPADRARLASLHPKLSWVSRRS